MPLCWSGRLTGGFVAPSSASRCALSRMAASSPPSQPREGRRPRKEREARRGGGHFHPSVVSVQEFLPHTTMAARKLSGDESGVDRRCGSSSVDATLCPTLLPSGNGNSQHCPTVYPFASYQAHPSRSSPPISPPPPTLPLASLRTAANPPFRPQLTIPLVVPMTRSHPLGRLPACAATTTAPSPATKRSSACSRPTPTAPFSCACPRSRSACTPSPSSESAATPHRASGLDGPLRVSQLDHKAWICPAVVCLLHAYCMPAACLLLPAACLRHGAAAYCF